MFKHSIILHGKFVLQIDFFCFPTHVKKIIKIKVDY